MNLMSQKKLLTIISASNRPHHMHGFMENLLDTVEDPACLELLVKIDEGDNEMQLLMEAAVKKYPYVIRYIQTPRLNGYYTLHYSYQQLWEMSNPDTYFIFPVNEEVRFKTQGWDSILAKYVKFFDDDVFRLKISRLKYRNYYRIHECGPTPENYPFITRKWMELAEGIGDCWGPDGWHQYIDYHLGQTEGIDGIPGIFRSIPIQNILIGGEEAGKELTAQQIKIRTHRILQEWWRMYRTEAQLEFRRIAVKMFAYIWAKNEGLEDFEIVDVPRQKFYKIRDKSGHILKRRFYYHISVAYIRFENFRFLIKMARRNSIGSLLAFIYPSYGPTQGIKKQLNYLTRYFIVCIAILLSFLTSADESIPKYRLERLAMRFWIIIKYFAKKLYFQYILKKPIEGQKLKALTDNESTDGEDQKKKTLVGACLRVTKRVYRKIYKKFYFPDPLI